MTRTQQEMMDAPAADFAEGEGDRTQVQAQAQAQGVTTVFRAEGLTRVPSDNQAHRVPLASFTSDFEVVHIAIPKIQPHAFMRAISTNHSPFPLLPGPVDVNVGDEFVGRGMMRLTASGEKLRLGIGRDENVTAEIKPVPGQSERKNRGANIQSVQVFEVKMSNTTAGPVKLSVLDQLPVAATNDISVTYGAEARNALRGANFPGQLQWEKELAAGETASLQFDFTVDYPEAMRDILNSGVNQNVRFFNNVVTPQRKGAGDGPAAAPRETIIMDSVDAKYSF